MDYILSYFIIGYFISLSFYLMILFSPMEEKFKTKDCILVIFVWPLVVFEVIKEFINKYKD
jgi:hypothetical protein